MANTFYVSIHLSYAGVDEKNAADDSSMFWVQNFNDSALSWKEDTSLAVVTPKRAIAIMEMTEKEFFLNKEAIIKEKEILFDKDIPYEEDSAWDDTKCWIQIGLNPSEIEKQDFVDFMKSLVFIHPELVVDVLMNYVEIGFKEPVYLDIETNEPIEGGTGNDTI